MPELDPILLDVEFVRPVSLKDRHPRTAYRTGPDTGGRKGGQSTDNAYITATLLQNHGGSFVLLELAEDGKKRDSILVPASNVVQFRVKQVQHVTEQTSGASEQGGSGGGEPGAPEHPVRDEHGRGRRKGRNRPVDTVPVDEAGQGRKP